LGLKGFLKVADDIPDPAAADSIARGWDEWMAELPGVDPRVEAARRRLAGLGRLLEIGLEEIAARHGFTLGDWDALSALQRSGTPYERSPKELAEAVGVTSGTMSVRIGRLSGAGLVERASDRADGRSRPIRLTAEGSQRWRVATAERTELESALIGSAVGASELEQLNRLLAQVLAVFEEKLGDAPVRGPIQRA
jgi:DNA-binding MarR family transcriptional regulator